MLPQSTSAVNRIADQIQPINTGFSQALPWDEFFNEILARQGAELRTNEYFNPIRQDGLRNIDAGFADRGLFRGGQRGRDRGRFNADIDDQSASMIGDLFALREAEDIARYNLERERFEKDPAGYVRPVPAMQAGKFRHTGELTGLKGEAPRYSTQPVAGATGIAYQDPSDNLMGRRTANQTPGQGYLSPMSASPRATSNLRYF